MPNSIPCVACSHPAGYHYSTASQDGPLPTRPASSIEAGAGQWAAGEEGDGDPSGEEGDGSDGESARAGEEAPGGAWIALPPAPGRNRGGGAAGIGSGAEVRGPRDPNRATGRRSRACAAGIDRRGGGAEPPLPESTGGAEEHGPRGRIVWERRGRPVGRSGAGATR
ncbi:hypothetical protein SEVIR_2G118750v4 [Setaria viridis]